MSSTGLLWWGAAAVLAALAAWIAVRALWVHLARRRARRFRPPPAKELRWETGPARSVASPPGMPPALAEHVRRDAEDAARRAAATGAGTPPPNPYPGGTPEFVLWVASYHLAMTQFEATIPPAPAAGGINPP